MKKFLVFLFLLVLTGQYLNAQISKATLLNQKAIQYSKCEWEIRLVGTWENPYLQEDVALDMLIKAPSGKKLTLPCYYTSGESGKESVWSARFAPQEKGKYTYTFTFNKAGNMVSTSKPAVFNVTPSTKTGFLHPKNNWILQFDNGTPFRGIGENICWESRANDDSKFLKKLHENPK